MHALVELYMFIHVCSKCMYIPLRYLLVQHFIKNSFSNGNFQVYIGISIFFSVYRGKYCVHIRSISMPSAKLIIHLCHYLQRMKTRCFVSQ